MVLDRMRKPGLRPRGRRRWRARAQRQGEPCSCLRRPGGEHLPQQWPLRGFLGQKLEAAADGSCPITGGVRDARKAASAPPARARSRSTRKGIAFEFAHRARWVNSVHGCGGLDGPRGCSSLAARDAPGGGAHGSPRALGPGSRAAAGRAGGACCSPDRAHATRPGLPRHRRRRLCPARGADDLGRPPVHRAARPVHGFEWDNDINRWLAEHRSSVVTDLWLGSTVAGGLVIPAVVGVLLVAFVVSGPGSSRRSPVRDLHRVGSYRATTLVTSVTDLLSIAWRGSTRQRALPPATSRRRWRSTAACCSCSHRGSAAAGSRRSQSFSRSPWRSSSMARMYRGMHHLTDSAAGVIMGLLALGITCSARAATAAANARTPHGARAREERRRCRPRRQDDRRRARGAAPRAAGAGVEDPYWSEVPKSKCARARRACAGRRRELCSCGAATDGAAVRRRDGGEWRDDGDRPAEPRTCSPPTSGSRRTSPRRSRSAPRPNADARRRKLNGERFAVMAGAGLDAR